MEFRKYQHVERFGNLEVQGIEFGTCYIFPKLDGTNASVWLDEDGHLRAGSRKRELTIDKDNAGFYNAISKDERILNYLKKHPTHRLFGEWLVPHSLKTYQENAWRKFYIFDVCLDNDDGTLEYIPYDVYKPWLEEFNLEYIAPIRVIINGDYESFVKCLDQNDFLIECGKGVGEGIVIKNYDFYNRYGRQTWAKIVTSEFKEVLKKTKGSPTHEKPLLEQEIVDKYITKAFVEKEYAKIVNEEGGWSSKMIPRLLDTVYYEFIREECADIVFKFKNPTINFKMLKVMTTNKIKEIKPDIFG
jgi:hypothetical protein